ncbi:hypothetical protein BRN73_08895, partial [Xanthomonas oryzae pv. oryzae]
PVPLACSSPVRASRLSKGSYTVQFTDSSDERRSLRIDDDAAVQEAIETYGQIVRSGELVR